MSKIKIDTPTLISNPLKDQGLDKNVVDTLTNKQSFKDNQDGRPAESESPKEEELDNNIMMDKHSGGLVKSLVTSRVKDDDKIKDITSQSKSKIDATTNTNINDILMMNKNKTNIAGPLVDRPEGEGESCKEEKETTKTAISSSDAKISAPGHRQTEDERLNLNLKKRRHDEIKNRITKKIRIRKSQGGGKMN